MDKRRRRRKEDKRERKEVVREWKVDDIVNRATDEERKES